MSLTTQYTRWGVESDVGVAIGAGNAGATYAPFIFKGWTIEEEDFDLKYFGIGIGGSLGARLTEAQEMAVSGLTQAGNVALSEGAPSSGPPATVTFPGRSRNAQSFRGFGHLAEVTITPGVGFSFQVLLFNLNLSVNALPTVLDLIIKAISGELSWSRLNHICPAWAGIVAPTVGLGAGAMIYTGRYLVEVHTEGRTTPRDGLGARHQMMNRRIRPRR